MDPNLTTVTFHQSAVKDLNLIREKNIKLHKDIVYRCLLLRVDPIPDGAVSIKSCKQKGYEIYRLKKVEFPSHRALYAIDEDEDRIIVFGIMPRSVDYDMDSPFMKRIVDDYINCFRGDYDVIR